MLSQTFWRQSFRAVLQLNLQIIRSAWEAASSLMVVQENGTLKNNECSHTSGHN